MSIPKAKYHLQVEQLHGTSTTSELGRFVDWLQNLPEDKFEAVGYGITKCVAEGKKEAVKPLLQCVGIQNEVYIL